MWEVYISGKLARLSLVFTCTQRDADAPVNRFIYRSIFHIVNKKETKMGAFYICLLVVCFIVICESVPVARTEIENVHKNDKLNKVVDGFVSETEHNIVKRSKRSGIIHGHLCPTGTGKLFSTGDCVPCNGYVPYYIFAFSLD